MDRDEKQFVIECKHLCLLIVFRNLIERFVSNVVVDLDLDTKIEIDVRMAEWMLINQRN